MSIYTKVSGSWKSPNEIKVKVSDEWKNVSNIFVKVNGVWKKGWSDLSEKLFYVDTYGDGHINEINLETLSSIQEVPPPVLDGKSNTIGGTKGRLFYAEYGRNFVFELNAITYASIKSSHNSEYERVYGIGGTANKLFMNNYWDTHEINLNNPAVIVNSVDTTHYTGIGGITDNLYTCEGSTTYEFNQSNFSIIRSVYQNLYDPREGIGGINNRLFVAIYDDDHEIHEMNPSTLFRIRSKNTKYYPVCGIGGIKK